MMNFICADNNMGAGTIIIYVVLILVLLAMLIMPYFTQKKKNQEFAKMLNSIKVGDLVKTAGGIIGKVTKITDKGEIKTVILETGSKTEKSYMEFDLSMIYCVLKSTKAPAVEEKFEIEESAKVEENKTEDAKVEESKAEDAMVEETANDKREEKAETEEAKKPAKKTTKKTTSTAKKSTKK